MAEHASVGTVDGPGGTVAGPVLGAVHADGEMHHPGKPISWAGVAVVCAGFIIGGVSMVPSPTWWLFWLGAGIGVVGIIVIAAAKTFNEDWY